MNYFKALKFVKKLYQEATSDPRQIFSSPIPLSGLKLHSIDDGPMIAALVLFIGLNSSLFQWISISRYRYSRLPSLKVTSETRQNLSRGLDTPQALLVAHLIYYWHNCVGTTKFPVPGVSSVSLLAVGIKG